MAFDRATWLGAVVLLVAIAIRGVWVSAIDPEPLHDARWYVARAKSIAIGDGYSVSKRPTAYRPAGYPVLLGATFSVFGNERVVIRVSNLVISSLTVLALFALAKRLSGSNTLAVSAAALFAVYPADVAYTSLAVSEPLFNLLMLSAFVALTSHRRWVRIALGGAALCGALLTRAQGLVLLACVVPLIWGDTPAARRERWFGLRELAALLVVVVALAGPYWWRNFNAFGGFVPVSNNGGVNLFIGNHALASGGYRFDRKITRTLEPMLNVGWLGSGGRKEYLIDRQLNGLALKYIAEEPSKTLALLPEKLRRLYRSDHAAVDWNRDQAHRAHPYLQFAARATGSIYAGIWLCAALAVLTAAFCQRALVVKVAAAPLALALCFGLAISPVWGLALVAVALGLSRVARIEARTVGLAAAAIAALTLVQVPYFGDARFHHPMMPWAALLAGASVESVAGAIGRVRSALRQRSLRAV